MRNFKSPPIHRTPLYRATASFNGMKVRCLNANGKNPTYSDVELRMTLDEWLEWAVPRFEQFIADNPGVSPSAARRGDAGHYEIGNIEIISSIENRQQQAMPGQLQLDGTKRCARCKEFKFAELFSSSKRSPDKLHHHCRSCRTLFMQEWRAKKNGPVTRAAMGADS